MPMGGGLEIPAIAIWRLLIAIWKLLIAIWKLLIAIWRSLLRGRVRGRGAIHFLL